MLPWIPENSPADTFPHPSTALSEPNGLLAAGGDLSPSRLIAAYSQGIFPWFSDGEPILWWSPEPRAVIEPENLHCSRSLKRDIRRGSFTATLDTAFDQVITACAQPRTQQDGTWITADMQQAYTELHQLGHAHSIEIWQQQTLVGGLYGVCCGRAFFGESMFSNCRNGSKIALAALCQQLSRWQFQLLDCQVESNHLASMGAEPWPRRKFLSAVTSAAQHPPPAGPIWTLDPDLQNISDFFAC